MIYYSPINSFSYLDWTAHTYKTLIINSHRMNYFNVLVVLLTMPASTDVQIWLEQDVCSYSLNRTGSRTKDCSKFTLWMQDVQMGLEPMMLNNEPVSFVSVQPLIRMKLCTGTCAIVSDTLQLYNTDSPCCPASAVGAESNHH